MLVKNRGRTIAAISGRSFVSLFAQRLTSLRPRATCPIYFRVRRKITLLSTIDSNATLLRYSCSLLRSRLTAFLDLPISVLTVTSRVSFAVKGLLVRAVTALMHRRYCTDEIEENRYFKYMYSTVRYCVGICIWESPYSRTLLSSIV